MSVVVVVASWRFPTCALSLIVVTSVLLVVTVIVGSGGHGGGPSLWLWLSVVTR
jgi:hypothetical protein